MKNIFLCHQKIAKIFSRTIKKLTKLNSNLPILIIDDVLTLQYKRKLVELIDFKICSNSKNSKFHNFLYLKTQNLNQIESQSAAWSSST